MCSETDEKVVKLILKTNKKVKINIPFIIVKFV